MKNHFRILFALLRKNNSHPTAWQAPLFVLLLAGISAWDAKSPFSGSGWLATLLWIVVLGICGGLGAFSTDLKNDYVRFLDYLPIRRWHVWLANVLDGLFWVGLFILATIWYRTLHWPPPVDLQDPAENELCKFFLHDRFTLPIGCAAVGACAFFVSAYSRLAIERDSTAMARAFMGAIFVVSVVFIAPAIIGVFPALDEAAVPLFFLAFLYAVASFVTFMFVPRHWGWFKRFLVFRVPTFLVVLPIASAIILMMVSRWSKYDPHDVEHLGLAPDVRLGDRVAMTLWSRRSGAHLSLLNPKSRGLQMVGRGLSFAYRDSLVAPSVLDTTFGPDGIRPSRGRVGFNAADGRVDWSRYLLDSFSDRGRSYTRTWVRWSTDGLRSAFIGTWRNNDRRDTTLFITNSAGEVTRRHRLADDQAVETSDCRVVFLLAGDSSEESVRHLLYSIDSDTERQIVLPGRIIACNSDLSLGLCLCVSRDSSQNGSRRQRYRVDEVELQSGKSHIVIPPGDLPLLDPSESASSDEGDPPDRPGDVADRWPSFRAVVVGPHGGCAANSYYGFYIDGRFSQIAWESQGTRNSDAQRAIKIAPLSPGVPGAARDLMPAAVLATRTDGRPFENFWLNLEGFTDDGHAIVYRNPTEMVLVNILDGSRHLMAKTDKPSDYATFQLSPDKTRVAVTRARREGEPGPRRRATICTYWEDGSPKDIVFEGDRSQVSWYDNDRLLIAREKSIEMFDLRDKRRQIVFTIGD